MVLPSRAVFLAACVSKILIIHRISPYPHYIKTLCPTSAGPSAAYHHYRRVQRTCRATPSRSFPSSGHNVFFHDMVSASEMMNVDQRRQVFTVKNHPHSITIATDGPTELILPSIERYRYDVY